MPTDLRFRLQNDLFTVAANQAPSAAAINSASLYRAEIPFGPFVELDDEVDFFDGWDLPITSMTMFAREVPESVSLMLLAVALVGCLSFVCRRR
jgi:hypothetical protein